MITDQTNTKGKEWTENTILPEFSYIYVIL